MAETTIDDQTYTVRARNGASCALARILVDKGITDSPIHIISKGFPGYMGIKSFYHEVLHTISEGRTDPPRKVKWTDQTLRYENLKRENVAADDDIDADASDRAAVSLRDAHSVENDD